jgi:hypothetical protein
VEGLRLRDGVEYLLADNADTFALQVTRLLVDENLSKDLSIAALNFASANLSAESFTKKVKDIAQIFE